MDGPLAAECVVADVDVDTVNRHSLLSIVQYEFGWLTEALEQINMRTKVEKEVGWRW